MRKQNPPKADEAIAAYQKVLADDPKNKEAFFALVRLYDLSEKGQEVRDTISKRGSDTSIPQMERAQIWTMLEAWYWRHAAEYYDFEKKTKLTDSEKQSYRARVQSDITLGLRAADLAVQLYPWTDTWNYRAGLLNMASDFSDLPSEKAAYRKQADDASKHAEALGENGKINDGDVTAFFARVSKLATPK
jgi:hypothetical protein